MIIKIGPRDIHLLNRPYKNGFQVIATWRHHTAIGDAEYLLEDNGRALITMIEVYDYVKVGYKFLCFGEIRESFQRRGIGSRILREVVRQSKKKGAHEVYGKITERHLKATPKLLKWYKSEGFEIFGPDPSDGFPHVHRIVRKLD